MTSPAQSVPSAAVREPTRRLFFALWPDEEQRAVLAHATRKAVRSSGGRPVPEQSLHVTLAFMGSVPEARLAGLQAIARRIAQPAAAQAAAPQEAPILVSFDRLLHWARPRILCVLASEAPVDPRGGGPPRATELTAATALAESLKRETSAAGFTPDLKPFHAHVTVARKVAHARPAEPLPPIEWRFDTFALVESRTDPGGPVYSVIESYLLVKAEKAHE
jgi:2'-5' RNA ligase